MQTKHTKIDNDEIALKLLLLLLILSTIDDCDLYAAMQNIYNFKFIESIVINTNRTCTPHENQKK